MNKIMRIGTIKTYRGGHVSVYIRAEDTRNHLSICGVIGPSRAGNAYGGCGQIDMEFAHRNEADNDSRYSNPTKPQEFSFAKGWNARLWLDLLDIWKQWHFKENYPQSAIDFINSLPDTDREPAWC